MPAVRGGGSHVVDRRSRRDDAVPKVTGEFAYASDLSAPGMLWGDTLRSPHPHALIVALDVSAALGLPGVHSVLTQADVPGRNRYGLEFADQPVLADASALPTVVAEAAAPIDDVRATAAYRRHALRVLAGRALDRCLVA